MGNDQTKIIQLTDTHLFADKSGLLYSTAQCNQTFDAVLQHIQQHELQDADGIFLTGDVSQDETSASYQYCVARLQELNLPVYWIPGNHDNVALMKSVFSANKNFFSAPRLSLPHWEIIFLNSQILGESTGSGNLSVEQINVLEQELRAAAHLNKSIAIVLHHHVVPVGNFLDRLMLQNHAEFLNKIRDTNVKLVINGHVHNDYRFKQDGIAFESGPATCMQFKKGAEKFALENWRGYKIYRFARDFYSSQAIMLPS